MYPPGLRLRQAREALGLTYRDVERASYQIAVNRGRPDFILHISRLADIENRGVVPSLHKLYSLAAIFHLDPAEISSWYDVPLSQTFREGAYFPPPRTHLSASPATVCVYRSPGKSGAAGKDRTIVEEAGGSGSCGGAGELHAKQASLWISLGCLTGG